MIYTIWKITSREEDTYILINEQRLVIDCKGATDFLGIHLINDDEILKLDTQKGTRVCTGEFDKLSEYPELFL